VRSDRCRESRLRALTVVDRSSEQRVHLANIKDFARRRLGRREPEALLNQHS
jgi:hypothetical protein